VRIRDDALADEIALNLTSLIDVVFLLLVFFMVATTFLDPERQLDLDLPQAASGVEREMPPEELVLNVFRDGRIALGGRELDDQALRGALERAARSDPATPVTIRGDARVEHARIVAVMDACALAGLSNLSVGTLKGTPAAAGG
jgi:biopolymer transport protein ExbD